MEISTLIKTLRKNQGLTQIDVARKLGIAQKVVSDYEKGKIKPSRDKLPTLAKILGISVDELLGTEELKLNGKKKHIHGNSRVAKLQDMFLKLNSADQRAVLKHINGLLAQAEQKKNKSKCS